MSASSPSISWQSLSFARTGLDANWSHLRAWRSTGAGGGAATGCEAATGVELGWRALAGTLAGLEECPTL